MRLWATKRVRPFIYPHFGIEYCRARGRQLLHAVGFRLRRLRHRPLKAKPHEQATCLAALPALLQGQTAAQERLCVDEATVRRHPTLTAPWCLVEDIPAVPTGDDHTKMPGYGAAAPLTGRTHDHMGSVLGKGEFTACLRHLLTSYQNTRVLVLHDRAEQHKGAAVEALREEAAGRLVLKPPPAYSPALHPEERIWKWRRRVVPHNHWFETLQEEIHAIRDFFCYLAGRKEEVRRLCALKIPESLLALLYGVLPGETGWSSMFHAGHAV